jgi:zinc ribbon protein
MSPSVASSSPASPASAPSAKVTPEQRTVKCPKCGATAREVARFCQRCHMTLRFSCPACKNEQRNGGTCEKCGVDFLKYIVAVVDAKKQSRDAEQERFERRTGLVKNILAIPLTGGLSLLALFRPKKTPAK